MPKFGEKSKKQLKTLHANWQLILNETIKRIDFSILEGHRKQARQMQLFKDGLSELDGVNKLSMHQHFPSLAVDIIPYEKGHNPFDGSEKSELMFYRLAREIMISANRLGIEISWGGLWTSIIDYPHWQLK